MPRPSDSDEPYKLITVAEIEALAPKDDVSKLRCDRWRDTHISVLGVVAALMYPIRRVTGVVKCALPPAAAINDAHDREVDE
jgi:hypothetical protein